MSPIYSPATVISATLIGRAGDRAVELEVVPDGLDALEDAAQVARDRDLGDGIGDLAVLDPQAERPARDVARHGIQAVAERPDEEEPFLDPGDDVLRRDVPRLEEEVGRADPAAVGAPRRLQAELARRRRYCRDSS